MNADIICIVDDDQIFQLTTTKILEKVSKAKKILAFSDGEQAYEFLSGNTANMEALPDIIFLDINMPFMDGWQFLEEYTKIKPTLSKQIVIYVVSSSISEYDIERARNNSNVSDYFVKPITVDTYKTLIALVN